jgi:hypothetical protein
LKSIVLMTKWKLPNTSIVATLALGSRPRQSFARLQAKREGHESHLVLPWVQKSVRAWTFTLPSEFPFWELESRWIPKSSKGNCRGQNPLAWRLFYIIGNLLKRRCLKCARITHLDIWNTSYDQMKSRKSNWQFDSWPLKAANRPDSLVFRWRATHREKVLHKGYNFALDLIVIRGLHAKLWAPKVARIQVVGISGLPLGNPRTKWHLDVAPVERCRIYYKGEGGGLPQVWAVVNLVSPKLPVARPSTKSA